MKTLISSILTWVFIVPLRRCLLLLPVKMSLRVAGVVGAVYATLSHGHKRRMKNQLATLFPEKTDDELSRIFRNTCRVYIQTEVEDYLYCKITDSNIDRLAQTQGLEHVDAALRNGNGAVLLHAHFGNPKMILPALGYKGYAVNQMGLSPTDVFDNLRDLMGTDPPRMVMAMMKIKAENEKALPATFIHLGGGVRPAVNCLRRNELLAASIDGVRGKLMSVGFMGRTVQFLTGAIRLAARTGAALLPVFVVRRSDHSHLVSIEPPIVMEDEEDAEARIRDAAEKFTEILVQYFKRYPCHYARLLAYDGPPFNPLQTSRPVSPERAQD